MLVQRRFISSLASVGFSGEKLSDCLRSSAEYIDSLPYEDIITIHNFIAEFDYTSPGSWDVSVIIENRNNEFLEHFKKLNLECSVDLVNWSTNES
jgi:hypothetical protein